MGTLIDTSLGTLLNRTAFLYKFGTGKIGFIQLDCTLSETHSRTATVTQNEIEDGSEIADNVVLKNETFTLEGIISEAPLPSNDIRDIANRVQNAGFTALNKGLGMISGGLLTNSGATVKRVIALIQLENFWKNKIPFTVITGLKKYDNVIITNLSIPVEPGYGKSLRFKVECEVVRVVASKRVKLSNLKKTAKTGATKKQDLAKQEVKAAKTTILEGIRKGGWNAVRGLFTGGAS